MVINIDLLILLLLGHFLGDYFFQTKNMALNKCDKSDAGVMYCLSHCFVYAFITTFIVVVAFDKTYPQHVFFIVFTSHYFIDRYSLGQKWLDFINGRNVLQAFKSEGKYRDIDLVFSCIVYTVVDNIMHLALMYLGLFYLV